MENIINQVKLEEEKAAQLYLETEQKLKTLLEQKKEEMKRIIEMANEKALSILRDAMMEGEKKALAELDSDRKKLAIELSLLEDRFNKCSEEIAEEILEDFVLWRQFR